MGDGEGIEPSEVAVVLPYCAPDKPMAVEPQSLASHSQLLQLVVAVAVSVQIYHYY